VSSLVVDKGVGREIIEPWEVSVAKFWFVEI
jgi:hypothetical protein